MNLTTFCKLYLLIVSIIKSLLKPPPIINHTRFGAVSKIFDIYLIICKKPLPSSNLDTERITSLPSNAYRLLIVSIADLDGVSKNIGSGQGYKTNDFFSNIGNTRKYLL